MAKTSSLTFAEYISLQASRENISISELEKRIEICDIKTRVSSFSGIPFVKAEKDFEEKAKGYDIIVNVKRIPSVSWLKNTYEILGTGVKLNKSKY
jgi:hypothetical protein